MPPCILRKYGIGAPRNAIASDEGKVDEPGWHVGPCGNRNIATGGDFQKIAILPEQPAANAGQGAFRISREANLTRLGFEPAHFHRDSSQH